MEHILRRAAPAALGGAVSFGINQLMSDSAKANTGAGVSLAGSGTGAGGGGWNVYPTGAVAGTIPGQQAPFLTVNTTGVNSQVIGGASSYGGDFGGSGISIGTRTGPHGDSEPCGGHTGADSGTYQRQIASGTNLGLNNEKVQYMGHMRHRACKLGRLDMPGSMDDEYDDKWRNSPGNCNRGEGVHSVPPGGGAVEVHSNYASPGPVPYPEPSEEDDHNGVPRPRSIPFSGRPRPYEAPKMWQPDFGVEHDRVWVSRQSVFGGPIYTYSNWTGSLPFLSGGSQHFPGGDRAGGGDDPYEKHRVTSYITWDKDKEFAALSPDEWRSFPIQNARYITNDTKVLRVRLPSLKDRIGMEVCSYILTRTMKDGKEVVRPYTPISLDYNNGYFDLMVKKYDGGPMSSHIHDLKPGQYLHVKGPFKKIDMKPNTYEHVGLIGGGTGVTALYQIATSIITDPRNKTNVSMVLGAKTPKEHLLYKELLKLSREWDRFHLYLMTTDADQDWMGHIGNINADIIRTWMPQPGTGNLTVVCGTDGLVEAVAGKHGPKGTQGELGGMMKALGFPQEEVFKM